MLWVVASAAAYSMFAVFTKWVLVDDPGPDDLRATDLVVWRFAVAVPIAWSLVLARSRRGGPRPSAAHRREMLVLGALFGVLAWLAFAGLERLPAALYTVVIYTYPAMVALGATLLGRPAPRALWGALVVTMAGIALTVPEVFTGGSLVGPRGADAALVGLLLTVGNAAAYAVYVLASGRLVAGRATRRGEVVDGLVTTTWSLTGSLVFGLVLAGFVGLRTPPDAAAWIGVVGLAVVSTVVAGATLMIGLRSLPAPTAATIATLEPLLTLVWAVTLLDERLRTIQLAGAALVLAGVTWAQRVGVTDARSARADQPRVEVDGPEEGSGRPGERART